MKSNFHITFLCLLFFHPMLWAQNFGDDLLDQPRFKELSVFTQLKVSSGVIVNLIPSTENKIEVYGDRYGGIVAKQKGNTLKLKMRLSELIHDHSIYVDLYFSKP
ncbi:MAG: hypothetical protein VW080_10665, partial [Flavobacteriaceae bacterium]